MKFLKVLVASLIFVSMALLPVLAGVEIDVLWGTQTRGWGMTNAKTDGNVLELMQTAEVTKVEGTAKSFCIWSGGKSVLCGNKTKKIVGETLGKGKYTVLAGLSKGQRISRVNIHFKYVE